MSSVLPSSVDAPRSILILKSHSAGIGDLLRSSAAWRALKNSFPTADLHLWFISSDPGAASEKLIGRHHLLASFHVSDKTKRPGRWHALQEDATRIATETRPNLIIDFEPNGLRTSWLTRKAARANKSTTVGIAENPLRRFFYDHASPSRAAYARRHELALPLEYTERDFVALAALDIVRGNTRIELEETAEAGVFRSSILQEMGKNAQRPILGLNIGCATEGALDRRVNLEMIARLIQTLQERHGMTLVLCGAPYERPVNQDFLKRFPPAGPYYDLSGRSNLLELAGLISACQLFVTSDSGPYHMAVGLGIPTLALFNFDHPVAYHRHSGVECVVAPDPASAPAAILAAERLMQIQPTPYHP